MSREALARAQSGTVGLGESPSHDAAPVDRLHAVGAAQRVETYQDCRDPRGRALLVCLGRDLIAHIDGAGEAWRCEIGLANILRWREFRLRLMPHTALLVARQTLREVKENKCRVCRGRVDGNGVHSIPDADKLSGRGDQDGPIPMRACPSCGGTGLHRWGDGERAEMVGEAVNFARAFVIAHGLIGQAMRECMTQYTHLLRD